MILFVRNILMSMLCCDRRKFIKNIRIKTQTNGNTAKANEWVFQIVKLPCLGICDKLDKADHKSQ